MRYLIIVFLLFFCLKNDAQKIYVFSSSTEKYPSEMQEFLSISASKDRLKEIETLMQPFNAFWLSDSLTQDDKALIIKTTNVMTANKYNAVPLFDYFVKNILAIKRDVDNANNLQPWINSLENYIKRKKVNYLTQYLDASLTFFQTHYLFYGNNKIWKLNSGKMTIAENERDPVFVFNKVNLTGTSGEDSSLISQTSGTFFPIKQRWEGDGGKIFWTRLNLNTDQVYANLNSYRIDLKQSLWNADSVEFYDKRKFDRPIEGTLRDNFGYTKPNLNVLYPSFISSDYDLVIKDVFKNVDYQGGYSLSGLRVTGSGEGDNDAHFIFKHNDKKLVWIGSKSFVIDTNKIISDNVSVTIYLETVDSTTKQVTIDSIYQPRLSMFYSNSKRILSIYRNEQGLSKAPFYDSYHKVDFYAEELNWKLGEDFIDMRSLQNQRTESKAFFESSNFFSKERYEQLKGIDKINPVFALYNYINKVGTNEFYVEDFADYIKRDKETTMAYLMNLSANGFVIYDVDKNYVIAKDNVKSYILSYQGRIDYDVIAFNSVTDGSKPNASLNLRNNDIIMNGVESVSLSDSQDVKIFPNKGKLKLKKNRDFEFSGKIKAGKFDLYTTNSSFSYDKFEIEMPKIDSLSFQVKSFRKNSYGEYFLVRVKNVIQDLKGNLEIDKPNNKSGAQSLPDYPILNSKSISYVYYDKSKTFKNAYDRESFYYHLEPFSIKSLDNFETDGLKFQGYLASGGIFPDIEKPLMVQRDYSLGFETTTPAGGYPIYGGKGVYSDSIKLSNEGLKGNGQIDYLSSISKSSDFLFFPDSSISTVDSYEIKEQKGTPEYPKVIAKNVSQVWKPKQDLMEVKNINKTDQFLMYNSDTQLDGKLVLSPKGLVGGGIVNLKNAEMKSENYNFKSRSYNSDSSYFSLKALASTTSDSSKNGNEFSLVTKDVFKSNIDFDQRKGFFETIGGAKRMDFYENMYMCYMDYFTWFMDEAKVEIASKNNPMNNLEGKTFSQQLASPLAGLNFVSTRSSKDSLNFYSSKATYYQKQKLIDAFDVPFINVADASIRPASHEVKIMAQAELQEIKNADLLVSRTLQYHLLHDGTFKIKGANSYSGNAIYDYKDATNNIQNIDFNDIETDMDSLTIAKAVIDTSANFKFNQNFDFEGGVTLVGKDKYLTFDGGTRITNECDTLVKEKIKFVAQINPDTIKIPINDNILATTGFKLGCGLKTRPLGNIVYSSFFSSEEGRSDSSIIKGSGFLVFNNITESYEVASEEKLADKDLAGNIISLGLRNCTTDAEGKLDLVYNTGALQANAYGKARYFAREDSSIFDVSIPLNFYFSDKALEIFEKSLNAQSDLSPVSLDNDVYKIMLKNKVGDKLATEYEAQIAAKGGEYSKIPKDLISTIFISDVKMKYNSRTRSLVSTDKIGIASVGKIQVIKYVDGKMEIQNKGNTYKITIALDLGSNEYYYFEFKGNQTAGQLLAYSSNEEFNTIITSTKTDDRKLKTENKSDPTFFYYVSTPAAFKKFNREMEIKE